MRLVFGDEVLFEWNENIARFGEKEFAVSRNDWLHLFSGSIDKLPEKYIPDATFGIPVKQIWFNSINAFMAPEQVQRLYYLPYIELSAYLGYDRRISGILVSDLFKKCCI